LAIDAEPGNSHRPPTELAKNGGENMKVKTTIKAGGVLISD